MTEEKYTNVECSISFYLFFEKSNPKKAVLFSVLASLKGSCDAKQTAS